MTLTIIKENLELKEILTLLNNSLIKYLVTVFCGIENRNVIYVLKEVKQRYFVPPRSIFSVSDNAIAHISKLKYAYTTLLMDSSLKIQTMAAL